MGYYEGGKSFLIHINSIKVQGSTHEGYLEKRNKVINKIFQKVTKEKKSVKKKIKKVG